VAGFVEGGNDTLLVDTSNDPVLRVLSSRIDDGELLSKIAEDVAEQAKGVRSNEVDAFRVAVVTDRNLIFQRSTGQDDDLVLVELG
jgi:hypothetical protein